MQKKYFTLFSLKRIKLRKLIDPVQCLLNVHRKLMKPISGSGSGNKWQGLFIS